MPETVGLPDPTGVEGAGTELGPIEPTPLRVQVAERLRAAIVTGRLRPGTPLVETALAQQLRVSRAPIREAIQDLENDGLVETVAYRSKRVKPLTVRELLDQDPVGDVLGHAAGSAGGEVVALADRRDLLLGQPPGRGHEDVVEHHVALARVGRPRRAPRAGVRVRGPGDARVGVEQPRDPEHRLERLEARLGEQVGRPEPAE